MGEGWWEGLVGGVVGGVVRGVDLDFNSLDQFLVF